MLSLSTSKHRQEHEYHVEQEFTGEVDLFLIQNVDFWIERSRGQGMYLNKKSIVASLTGVELPAADVPIQFTVPPLSPTFDGFQEQSRKGAPEDIEAEPLKWRYCLDVHIRAKPLPTITTGGEIRSKLKGQPIRMQFPLVICSLGLQHLPPMNVQRFWQRPDLHPPVRSTAGWTVEWSSLPEVVDAVERVKKHLLEENAEQRWMCSDGFSVLVRDVEEDFACTDISALLLRPKYLLSWKCD